MLRPSRLRGHRAGRQQQGIVEASFGGACRVETCFIMWLLRLLHIPQFFLWNLQSCLLLLSHFQVKWCFQIKLVFSNKRVCKRGGAGRTRKKCFFFKYKHTKTYTETGALNRCLDLSCRSDTQERVHVMINHESSKKMSSYQTHDMWVTCSRVFLLLPRCHKSFHFHTMFLRRLMFSFFTCCGTCIFRLPFSESKLASEPSRWIC